MDLSVLTWNVRGCSRKQKRRALKNLIKKHRPDIMFIQETKVEALSVFEVKRLWYNTVSDYVLSPTLGSVGGLLSIWNSDFIQVSEKFVSRRYIAIIGVCKNSGTVCGFLNVYGPSIDSEKEGFLVEVLDFVLAKKIPWCLGGDFNLILDKVEKQGLSVNNAMISAFRNFVCSAGVRDLPLMGGSTHGATIVKSPRLFVWIGSSYLQILS
ncbi:hypothetical protein HRI_001578600 [Hibiscus trionum]|uniref:Endonuclease/exonuclease/phosphatase domain-containing protein n=1 Tax=Hibiscus trionum TaxID=183268 RepID=A0A9W7HKH4_HIBTR|nr:hypothetical protein HRI_001578600 [Hibiscus trionum]